MVSLALRSVSQQLPPLPDGFVLDQPEAQKPAQARKPPPPPPGFVIDAEPSQEAPAPEGFRYVDDPLSPGGRGLQPIPQKESWADKAKAGVADAVGYMAAPLTQNQNPAVRMAGEVGQAVGTGVGQWGVTTITDPIEGANQAVEAFSPMTPFSEGYQATGEAGQALMKGDIGEAAKQAVRAVSGYGGAALSVIPGGGLAKQAGAAPVKVTPREVLGSLAAEALDAPVRPQALDAISRILINSGVPRDRVNAGLGRVVDLLKEPASRAATVAQLLQREFGEEFPQVVDNVNIAVRERGLSSKPGDASPSIVREATQQMRGSQTGFLTESANRNLGDASRTGTREQMEENLREIGRTGYEPLLQQPVDPERASRIQSVLTGPGMSELGRPLRQIAAGEGLDLDAFIKAEPLRAAHWMQHKARLLAEDQVGKNAPLAGAYNSMRNRILSTMDDLKAPDGRTYADLRAEYGDEAAVGQALNAGNRFGADVMNPQGADEFVKSFNAMTDPQKQAALISIRDWVQSKLRGAPEDAPARIAELSKLGVLDALDKIGGGAKSLADDIRAIRSENEFLTATTNRGQSATIPNAQALKEGPKVYSRGPGSLGTVGTDVIGMLTGAWNGPMNTVLKGSGVAFDKVGRPLTRTREDMTRILMARQKEAQRAADAPTGPTSGLGGPADASPAPATALGATPEEAASPAMMPERNSAPVTALGAVGGGTYGYNSPLDLNGDGEISEEERMASGLVGTALGGVGGAALGRAATRLDARLPKTEAQVPPMDLPQSQRVFGPGRPDDLGFITSGERALTQLPKKFASANALTADQWRSAMKAGGTSNEGFTYQVNGALSSFEPGRKITRAELEEAMARNRETLGRGGQYAQPAGNREAALYQRTVNDEADRRRTPARIKKELERLQSERFAAAGIEPGRQTELDYSNYVTSGPREQYSQEVLTSPTAAREGYQSHNWRVPGALTHNRTTIRQTASGERVTHADEIQSDLHQEGAQYGYASPDIVANANAMKKAEQAAEEAEIKWNRWADTNYFSPFVDGLSPEKIADPVGRELYRNMLAAYERLDTFDLKSATYKMPPNAPMQDWEGPVVQRVLLKAMENGTDLVTFSSYDALHKALQNEGTKKFYDERLPRTIQRIAKMLGAKVETANIGVDSKTIAEYRGLLADRQEKLAKLAGKTDDRSFSASTKLKDEIRTLEQVIKLDGKGQEVPAIRLTPEAKKKLAQGVVMYGGAGVVATGAMGNALTADQRGAQ